MTAEMIFGFLIWMGLGAWGWWLYFRGGIRTLKQHDRLFVCIVSFLLAITFVAALLIGPVSFLALAGDVPDWE